MSITSGNPLTPLERALKKKRGNRKVKTDFAKRVDELREYYRKRSPVVFAMKFLTSPPLTPVHPKLGRIPIHIIPSPEQQIWLRDRWLGKANRNLVVGGRGSGKTLTKAIWNCWRIFCFDYYTINTMAGSSGQSTQNQAYIDILRRTIPEIGYEINRSVGGSPKEPPCLETRHWSKISFCPCSEQGSRSPHVNELDLDEVCSAEKTGKIEFMQAALWQVSTSPDVHISMSSTAHWIFGMFLEYIQNHKKLGYGYYNWSIAEHISGKSSLEVFRDKDPKHWKPKVWWITQEFIEQARAGSTDSVWLSECLGGISLASGNVFPTEDLNACICDVCVKHGKECLPYKQGVCIWFEFLKDIIERTGGADFGKAVPSGLVIAGRKGGRQAFILSAKEIAGGTRDTDIIINMETEMRKWLTVVFCPDPAQWGMGQAFENKGFTVYQLEPDNEDRYFNAKRHVEQRLVTIPVVYAELIKSLRNLVYDEDGNIVKINDHMADGFTYALSNYFLNEALMGNVKDRSIDRLW